MNRLARNLLAITLFAALQAPLCAQAFCWRHGHGCRWCSQARSGAQGSPGVHGSPGAKSNSGVQGSPAASPSGNGQSNSAGMTLQPYLFYSPMYMPQATPAGGDVARFISSSDLQTGMELARLGQSLLQRIRQIRAERLRNQYNNNRPITGGVDHSAQLDRIEKLLKQRLAATEQNTDTNTQSITNLGNAVEKRLLAIEEKIDSQNKQIAELKDSIPDEIAAALEDPETLQYLLEKLKEAMDEDTPP